MSSYVSSSHSLVNPFNEAIDGKLIDRGGFKKHGLARGGKLLAGAGYLLGGVVDSAIGAGTGLAAIATGGFHYKTFSTSQKHLRSTQMVVARTYRSLLQTINPSVKMYRNATGRERGVFEGQTFLISGEGDGLLTDTVGGFLKNAARSARESKHKIVRQVGARLIYPLFALSCVITRVIDGVIGIIAMVFSLLSAGTCPSLNHVAYRGLQAPGLVGDLFYALTKTINPRAGL